MNHLLEDTILHTVRTLVADEELFTALDVSNKVKEVLPIFHHREVREIVRNLFAVEIESAGYTRTNITVTLSNGDKANALLYHPLTDSWDLDAKYGTDRRVSERAGFIKFGQVVATPVLVSHNVPVSQNVQVTQTVSVSQTVTDLSGTDVWEQLFKSQPSLFSDK